MGKEGMNLLASVETDEILEYLMHELNTPLTVIKGYIEIIQDQNMDNPEITKYLKTIWKNAERIEKVPLNIIAKVCGRKEPLITWLTSNFHNLTHERFYPLNINRAPAVNRPLVIYNMPGNLR